MGKYVCGICGWVYSGDSDLPEDFECPECSAPRSEFVLPEASRIFVCSMCGFRYEEAKGSEGAGLPAGTSWDDVDPGFKCPLCGCGKNIFKRLRESNF